MGADDLWGPALSLHNEAINHPLHIPRRATPHMPRSPMDEMPPLEVAITSRDTVEVHVDEDELNNL